MQMENLRLRDVPDLVKDEFKFKNFRVDADNQHEFYMCHWQKRARKEVDFCFLLYRGALAILVTFLCLNAMYDPRSSGEPLSHKLKWFIYISSWSFMLITAQCIVGFAIIVTAYVEQRQNKKCYQPILNSIYWILSGVNCDMAPVISFVYWTDVYDEFHDPIDVANVSMHYLNCVIVFVELLLTAAPTRIYHFYWSLIVAVTYMIFNCLYEICGGTNWQEAPFVYEMTAWKRGYIFAFFSCIGLMLFMLAVRIGCYVVHVLKQLIYGWLCTEEMILPTTVLKS